MKKSSFLITRLIASFSVLCMVTGCDLLIVNHTLGLSEEEFMPGDCLQSIELTNYYFQINGNSFFTFEGWLDFDRERELVNRQMCQYRFAPPAAYFKSFNNNSKTVKKEYEAAYKQITLTYPKVSSVFYKEGGTLIADKDFAGHPAGENLLPYVFESKKYIGNFALEKNMFGSILDDGRLDADYILVSGFWFKYPIGDCEVFEEQITFTLDLPVKVGLFLEWMNDRISDPDAYMPYREETLHGTWTIEKSLRPKHLPE